MRKAICAVVAAAAVVTLPASAGATVVERGTYSDPIHFTYSDCGFPVHVTGTIEGRYRLRQGKGKDDQFFFGHDRFRLVETHTNALNGKYVTNVASAVFNEIKATRMSGNVFLVEAVEAGKPAAIYDSDGNLVARDRGVIHHRMIFDTLGDSQPGGTVIEFLEPRVSGPHPIFDDFCGIVAPLIG